MMRSLRQATPLLCFLLLFLGCGDDDSSTLDGSVPDAAGDVSLPDAAPDVREPDAEICDGEICGETCIDISSDPLNCGGCGNACAFAEICSDGVCSLGCFGGTDACGDECVDLELDPLNCGACGNACGAGLVCSEGACVSSCSEGTIECEGRCIDPEVDAANCGACGVVCEDGLVCSEGACGLACSGGTTLCAEACVQLDSDPSHCGGCGNECGPGELCLEGACGIECPEGTELCGERCVDLSLSTTNCGACDSACEGGLLCSEGTCALSCSGGSVECDDACVRLESDDEHCGACDNACADGLSCVEGSCELVCPEGTVDCGGTCVSLANSEAHCGACDSACDTGLTCVEGSCALVCGGGATLCDDECVRTESDEANCGACGNACDGDEQCIDGECALECRAGSTLCEMACVDTSIDPMNCGSCGSTCDAGLSCQDGSCVLSCSGGTIACGESCVSTSSDPSHCGACDAACSDNNATAVCAAGTCLALCEAGFQDCNGDLSDACEADLQNDATNCGGCGITCGSGACFEGRCQFDDTTVTIPGSAGCQLNLDTSTNQIDISESGRVGMLLRCGAQMRFVRNASTGGAFTTHTFSDMILPSAATLHYQGDDIYVFYDDRRTAVFVRRSTDGGSSWSAPVRIGFGFRRTDAGFSLSLTGDGENLYATYAQTGRVTYVSRDSGATWTPLPAIAATGETTMDISVSGSGELIYQRETGRELWSFDGDAWALGGSLGVPTSFTDSVVGNEWAFAGGNTTRIDRARLDAIGTVESETLPARLRSLDADRNDTAFMTAQGTSLTVHRWEMGEAPVELFTHPNGNSAIATHPDGLGIAVISATSTGIILRTHPGR